MVPVSLLSPSETTVKKKLYIYRQFKDWLHTRVFSSANTKNKEI